MSDTWQVEPHPTIPELDEHYAANAYQEPVRFASWTEQLENATMAELVEWARGGIGEPDAS